MWSPISKVISAQDVAKRTARDEARYMFFVSISKFIDDFTKAEAYLSAINEKSKQQDDFTKLMGAKNARRKVPRIPTVHQVMQNYTQDDTTEPTPLVSTKRLYSSTNLDLRGSEGKPKLRWAKRDDNEEPQEGKKTQVQSTASPQADSGTS